MTNPLRSRLSHAFRARRAVFLRRFIQELCEKDRGLSILDLGGRAPYWHQIGLEFLRRYNVSVTLLNLNVGELSEPDEHFGCVIGDARQLAFEDGEFDLVHSNSVIEHVGAWQDMEAFASETRRVGRSYYVQTPYFWFPVDPHFYGFPMFHWLPRQAKAWLLANLPLATAGKLPTSEQALHAVDSVKLLDGHQLRRLFPDAGIQFELLAGLPKSLIAVRKQTKARSGA